jgi:hypothetical protein
MAERPFLVKGLADSERDALIRSGVFDRDLFQAVYSKDWRRKYSPAEINRMKLLETQEVGSGWSYRGNLWDFYNFLRNRALDEYWDRQFRTGENLTDLGGGWVMASASRPDLIRIEHPTSGRRWGRPLSPEPVVRAFLHKNPNTKGIVSHRLLVAEMSLSLSIPLDPSSNRTRRARERRICRRLLRYLSRPAPAGGRRHLNGQISVL